MRRPSGPSARNHKHDSFIFGALIAPVVAMLAAGSWMAGWFLISSAAAVLAVCAIIWHTGSRQVRGALNYRASLLRGSPSGSNAPLSLSIPPAGSIGPQEEVPEPHEIVQGLQVEMVDARRTSPGRFASRRLLARRRPIHGPRRENLARWNQR
jgi:hypothetical protein